MKNWVTIGLLVVLVCTGCASSRCNWTDRGRDAADIFTATVGLGMGAKGRAGPLQTGLLLASVDGAGLRCGQWGTLDSGHWDPGFYLPGDSNVFLFGVESSTGGELPMARKKAYWAEQLLFVSYPAAWLTRGDAETARFASYPPPFIAWPYFTDIQVVVGAGPSVRLGFNPGELVDFILGWTGVDIYNDDVDAEDAEDAEQPDEDDGE
jgi:hypothetical protein